MFTEQLKTGKRFIKPAFDIGRVFRGGTELQGIVNKLRKGFTEGRGALEGFVPNPLKADPRANVLVEEGFFQPAEGGGFAELAGPVNGEIVALVHHFPDAADLVRTIDHVILIRHTEAGGIEAAHSKSIPWPDPYGNDAD
jgi:hypothetical protein